MPTVPAILDIEASGFGRGSYPIEAGFVLPDGRSGCMLIRPAPHWTHWDADAERLHHITRDTLQRHGRPIEDVVDALDEALGGLTVYSDGWALDYTWLATLYDAAGHAPRFRLENLRLLLCEDLSARWHETKRTVASEMALPRHRASSDARLLQSTYVRLARGRRTLS